MKIMIHSNKRLTNENQKLKTNLGIPSWAGNLDQNPEIEYKSRRQPLIQELNL